MWREAQSVYLPGPLGVWFLNSLVLYLEEKVCKHHDILAMD